MSAVEIIGGAEYTDRDYCLGQLLSIRDKFGDKNTTQFEWDHEIIRGLGLILINGPEDLAPIVHATLYEAQIRERHFALYIWPLQNDTKIKYFKWPKGKHWYAKIGNIDVVDAEGNQKWNTKQQAQKAAAVFKRDN